MKNNFSYKIKLIFEFIFFYFVYIILSKLPFFIVSNLGGIIFKFIGPKTKLNKIENLFIKKESKKNWFNIGRTFFELLILPKILNTEDRIIIEGKENIKDVIDSKEKAIFIGIHQSNWEILLPSIDKIGIPVVGIYRHINNPYINKLI